MSRLLSLGGLASHLRLPRKWLDEAARAKIIPCLQVGKKRLFNPDAVEATLSELAAKVSVPKAVPQ